MKKSYLSKSCMTSLSGEGGKIGYIGTFCAI